MKIHFIGIGGIGMSGLSAMYKAQGYEVSGSDRGADKPENQRILAPLKAQGIRIYPQDGSFFAAEESDFVVYSSAIEADNPDIGLMCFVAIGMAEVSTCEITVYDGQHVNKGDQTGMFHFGGSTHCLLFGPHVDIDFDLRGQTPGLDTHNIRVNEKIATVKRRKN